MGKKLCERLVIFLIRKRLGLKKGQYFQFTNQNSETDYYYFTGRQLIKRSNGFWCRSGVSLNWLLDPDCKVKVIDDVNVYLKN